MPRAVYRYAGAAWVRRGNPSIGGRPTNYGEYAPDETNTGLLVADYTHLDEYNSPATTSVTLTPGQELDGKIIYGKVLPPATVGAELSGCRLFGSPTALTSGNDAVLSMTGSARTGLVKLYDCEIAPQVESAGRNCALGWQYELHRCYLHGGEDLAGLYNTTGTDTNGKVLGCLLEDMGFTYPDRDHPDGSHCDGIQIQGGRYIEVIGNTIRGTAHYMAGSGKYYPTHTTQDLGDWPLEEDGINPGACIIVNGNVAAVDSTVKINQNYLHYGKSQLLIKSQANAFQAIGNRFSYVDAPAKHVNGDSVGGVSLTFTANPYWLRFDGISAYSPNVDGLTSGGVLANTTNVWLDGPNAGVPLTSPRASGIHSDA